jgi:hypothetical protein
MERIRKLEKNLFINEDNTHVFLALRRGEITTSYLRVYEGRPGEFCSVPGASYVLYAREVEVEN